MSNNGSYNNDRPASAVEAELATDPASGGFFHSDYKKHDDLKQMLDSSKDGLKLEAMKRIIGMVAKGRDASDLFPAVVKNVVSKNIEVKKLVYVYLVRYAEEQQDLALLSISTFQRALKDPNQLIRASALRVLSSIRVTMIVPIVMLAIKDSASDMSAYVRKTAAHAIPKLYSLDPEQKEELVHVIEKLLSDKTTLVVGSAVMAFEEVCPERIDLIHKNYRKLCDLLVDVDEWGQVVIINMLTRYARTQFTDPNIEDTEIENEGKTMDDSDLHLSDSDGSRQTKNKHKSGEKIKKTYSLDPDHRLLLRNARPLLQSRNASVVMGVAQMYHHLAPRSEVIFVAKALIRLLRSHREVQSVVLNCIASMSTQRKGMFEPFLKSFFVRTSDATHIKLLKLEILTTLATETSISVILREFQTYISSNDKEFVTATIQAIGRCAANIKEVTDTCLNGLVSLLSNRDEAVVGESVVVIKKLLQTQPAEHKDIITHMAKLVDNISVPAARASILWLLGEYSDRVPRIAPDVLRKMAKNFINEEDQVKLQTLNLAVKLFLVNPKQTKLLCHYVLNLARYDPSYDIRDRARFLKQFVFPSNENSNLAKSAKKLFLATKPAPVSESQFKDREQFQLGSLSHYINTRAVGYHDLPPFPEVAPESNRGVIASPNWWTKEVKRRSGDAFYNSDSSPADESEDDSSDSDDESSSDSDDSSSDSSSSSDDSDSSSSSSSSTSADSTSEEEVRRPTHTNRVVKKTFLQFLTEKQTSSESGDSDSAHSSRKDLKSRQSDSDNESSSGQKKLELTSKQGKQSSTKKKNERTNLDLLLELDSFTPAAPVMTPSFGGFLTPSTPSVKVISSSSGGIQATSPSFVALRSQEIVNKVTGRGLVISYRFTRSPHLFSPKMSSIELTFSNQGHEEISDMKMGPKNMPNGLSVHEFAPIGKLSPGATVSGTIGIDWNDSSQQVSFDINWIVSEESRKSSVLIKPNVGELLRAVIMPDFLFLSEQGKLRGMNEHAVDFQPSTACIDSRVITQKVYESANVASISSSDSQILRFAGQTLASQSLVLITVKIQDAKLSLCVNCEKMVIGSMLCNEIKSVLRQ